MSISLRCRQCRIDRDFLRSPQRRRSKATSGTLRVADLFSGLGGLSLGVQEACRRLGLGFEVALAADSDVDSLRAFTSNLPTRVGRTDPIESIFDGSLGAAPTASERELTRTSGSVGLLVGGPPCQGVSSLNNYTRMSDKRNQLYSRMARAAEVLRPAAVLIENVPGVAHDTSKVVKTTIEHLVSLGYSTSSTVLQMSSVGVPQRRQRLIVLGVIGGDAGAILLDALQTSCGHVRTVNWAIDDLEGLDQVSQIDRPTKPWKRSLKRMEYLLKQGVFELPNSLRPHCHQGEHSYSSMYGRLRWDRPAQTITSGFGSMGQGRFVHPAAARTITPHEAARLQTIPDAYCFPQGLKRTALAEMMGIGAERGGDEGSAHRSGAACPGLDRGPHSARGDARHRRDRRWAAAAPDARADGLHAPDQGRG